MNWRALPESRTVVPRKTGVEEVEGLRRPVTCGVLPGNIVEVFSRLPATRSGYFHARDLSLKECSSYIIAS
jgi:hypothetical protein